MCDLISPPKIFGAVCRRRPTNTFEPRRLLPWERADTNGIKRVCGSADDLLGELDDQRQLVGLDESQQLLFGQLSVKGVASLVKLETEDGNSPKYYPTTWFPCGFTGQSVWREPPHPPAKGLLLSVKNSRGAAGSVTGKLPEKKGHVAGGMLATSRR